MSDVEQLDSLNKKIEALKVCKATCEKENEKLTKELELCKKEIREKYGVEIEDFSNAINITKDNYIKKIKTLTELIQEAEDKFNPKNGDIK